MTAENQQDHQHRHAPNRFAAVPTHLRLQANSAYSGKGVTIAFLDSGYFPHPDIIDRVAHYHDVTNELPDLTAESVEPWQWHGTQTSVVAAGDGSLSERIYRSLAFDSRLVLVKVSHSGRVSEENIVRGLEWVIENRERFGIRVLNISLGGDQDVPCTKSTIDQAAEEAIKQGIVVVVAAGNSGHEGKHSIPPANSPSVITVGGYTDGNDLHGDRAAYQSNFGFTADGTLKPEVIAPAMWVAAPILPNTPNYARAEALSQLAAAFDYELPGLFQKLHAVAPLSDVRLNADASTLRARVETALEQEKIVATHYQHVDGTSFAAPIVSSLVAQMLEANPGLTPPAVKQLLIETAERIPNVSVIRQGYGVINARRALESALAETHVRASIRKDPARVAANRVSFSYHDDQATSVCLAGDFNDWNPSATPLSKDESGIWHVEITRPSAGRYEYKFVVDVKRWVEDPTNWLKTPDRFGGLNSILVVD